MLGSLLCKSTVEKYAYIKDVFGTLITRDTVQKHKIKNEILLKDFILDLWGHPIYGAYLMTTVL